MNSGYVATIDMSFAGDELRATGQQTTEGDYEWYGTPTGRQEITVGQTAGHRSQVGVLTGRVMWKTREQADAYYVSDGDIYSEVSEQTQTHGAEFAVVPAKQLLLLTDEAARFYVERMIPASIQMQEIDIREFVQQHEDGQQWGTGFGGRLPEDGGVQKGAVYGDDVKQDPELGEDLRRGYLNQVGVDYDWRTHILTAYLAESGYVAAHADDMGTRETIAWLIEEVQPALYDRDDEDDETEEEAATDGGGQSSLDDLDTVNDPSGGGA